MDSFNDMGAKNIANTTLYDHASFKPIPTSFKGVRYRSRTEANVAVALDNLGLNFFYESSTLIISSGELINQPYTPDFVFLTPACINIVEVKAVVKKRDFSKIQSWLENEASIPGFSASQYESVFPSVDLSDYKTHFYLMDQDGELSYCQFPFDKTSETGEYKPFLLAPAWVGWCPDCKQLVPRIDRLAGKYHCPECGSRLMKVPHQRGKNKGLLALGNVYNWRDGSSITGDLTEFEEPSSESVRSVCWRSVLGGGCSACRIPDELCYKKSSN